MSRDIVLAGVAVVAASADMAVKSESAAAAVAKSAGISAAAAQNIVKSFRGLPETEYSATKIATAFATVASELKVVEGHALTTAQATQTMRASLDLTDATGGNLVSTTEALGKVMLTYGLSAGNAARVTDVLFNASRQTGTSVEEVTQVIDRMHGRLGALAPSLEETAGLMEEFAKKGITGRQSLSALNGVFSTLEGGSKATAAAAKQLNLQIFDQNGQFVGLKSVLGQLQPVLAKYNQESQLAYTRALFGAGANRQLLAIIHDGPAAFGAATKAVEAHGTAAAAAAREHQTLDGKLKQARAAAENLGASIGERVIPALTAMLKAVEDSVQWLGKHKTAAEALAVVVGGVLGTALAVYAYSKAAAFVKATSAMIGGLKALAARVGLTAAAVDTADASMVASNAGVAGSFTAMAGTAVAALAKIGGAIAIAAAAIKGLELGLGAITGESQSVTTLLGGNQPGESTKEGEAIVKGGRAGQSYRKGFEKQYGSVNQFQSTAIEEAAHRYGIDPKTLLGVYGTETSYGKNISTSSAGAMGAFQFIPETARAYHYPLTNKPNESQFKAQAEAAAHYLAVLIKENHGDVNAALAQYSGQTPGYSQKVAHYGSGSLPSIESLTKKAAKPRKAPSEGYVSPFSHATGVTRSRTDQGVDFSFSGGLGAVGKGRIVNIVQDPGGFGTEIVEELTEGAHKGQFVYYGLETGATSLTRKGASVKAGAPLARGKGTGGIELGFASSAGGVPISPYAPGQSHEHPTVGGEQFSKFLASIGKTGSSLSTATATYEKAAKTAAEHLLLSAAQIRTVTGLSTHARTAREGAEYDVHAVGGVEARIGGNQKRISAQHLGTALGNETATRLAGEDVLFAKAIKTYEQEEIRELGREAKAWAKLRDQYRRFARHATGNAKTEAVHKAAAYDAKVKQAHEEAKALHGAIATQDEAVTGAQEAAGALTGEIQSANLSNYQGALSKIAAEERAGILTPDQAQAAKTATANRALSGGYGALSEEGRLQVLGDLKEFTEALKEGTNALEAHTQALEASAKALHEFATIGAVEAGSLAKSLADTVSGQIAGRDFAGQKLTAGVGVAARY